MNVLIGKPLPEVEISPGNRRVPQGVTDIGMTKNAPRGNVGRTGPYGDRLFLVNEDDELVMPDACAGRLGLAETFDASRPDHRLVVVFVGLGLVADVDIGARLRRGFKGLPDGEVAKLVEHGAELVVGGIFPGGDGNKARQGFEKPAR
jgi:hypothetical protein